MEKDLIIARDLVAALREYDGKMPIMIVVTWNDGYREGALRAVYFEDGNFQLNSIDMTDPDDTTYTVEKLIKRLTEDEDLLKEYIKLNNSAMYDDSDGYLIDIGEKNGKVVLSAIDHYKNIR